MLYYDGKKWRKRVQKTDHPTLENGGLELLPATKIVEVRSFVYNPKTNKREAVITKERVQDTNNINENKAIRKISRENTKLNEANSVKNQTYDSVLSVVNATRGGDYLQQRDNLVKILTGAGFAESEINDIKTSYDSFYKAEKIKDGWDFRLGAKPPAGNFDPAYYLTNNPEVQAQWDAAVASGDLDITEQYKSPQIFALSHYTFSGKPANKRGNAKEDLVAVEKYLEKKPTDKDLEAIRDKQLNITQEGLEDVTDDTDLEQILSEEVTADLKQKNQQFGALRKDVLKQTIEEMKKAKAQEQFMSLMGGLPGFQDVIGINETLTNSLLGDSGLGGILGFAGTRKQTQEGLEKSLQNLTGVNNYATYNWQQWFDNQLKTKYQDNLNLGIEEEGAQKLIDVDANFAREFIDTYVIPRFNQSKTMNEFVEYIDIAEGEENPFQTELSYKKMIEAANAIGSLRAQTYLDQLKEIQDAYFDPAFYFNPESKLSSKQLESLPGFQKQQELYKTQQEKVTKDWEIAKEQYKNKQGYWYSQAYRYGVNPLDKDAFAKLHYQVRGQSLGFDGAEDLWSPLKTRDYIYTQILPAVKEETAKTSVFGEFLNPDEFANDLLGAFNVNPEDKSTWGEVLDKLKIKDFTGSFDELKSYISDTFRTTSAIDIEEQIKELEKKDIKPTQKELGVFYLERPRTPTTPPEETTLYSAFKKAGFAGDEETFYAEFFPDLDIEEQRFLTKAGTGKLEFLDFGSDDPLAAFETLQTLSGEKGGLFDDLFATDDDESENYLQLGLDDEEDYKSKTGASILSDFTSFFKGF
jgi:hypothetical protein